MDAEDYEDESDDFDADALSYDDDELGEADGLVEEHPFEHDAPPQAVLVCKTECILIFFPRLSLILTPLRKLLVKMTCI